MGSMFKQYDEIDSIWDSAGIFYNDAKKWISYQNYWGKETINPFMQLSKDGTYKFKGLPTKDLAADAFTLTLDFYNRNLFDSIGCTGWIITETYLNQWFCCEQHSLQEFS